MTTCHQKKKRKKTHTHTHTHSGMSSGGGTIVFNLAFANAAHDDATLFLFFFCNGGVGCARGAIPIFLDIVIDLHTICIFSGHTQTHILRCADRVREPEENSNALINTIFPPQQRSRMMFSAQEMLRRALVQAPGQVQRGSGEGCGGRLWKRFQETLVQSQVKFNKVPEKVSEKAPVLGGFGAEPGHVQQGSGKRLRCRQGFGAEPGQVHQRSKPGQVQRVPEKVAEPKPSQVRCFQRFASQHAAGRCVKTTRCRCWGYHRGFFFPAVFFCGSLVL